MMEKNMNGSLTVSPSPEKTRGTVMKPLLECETCGRILSSAYKLREHVMIHTGQKPHACTKCSQAFRTKPDLARHMRIHTGVRPYACKLCGQRFYRSDNLKGHMKTHKDMEVLSCFKCGKQHATLEELNVHYKASHEKEDKAEHLAHLATLRKEAEEKSQKDSLDVSSQEEDVEVEVESPVKMKTSPVLKRRPSSPPGPGLNELARSSTPHTIWCEECGQGFHQKGALALHVKVAHPKIKKPLQELTPPLVRVESIVSDTAFICPTCGQVFTDIELLKDHISYTHPAKDDSDELEADENMNTRPAKHIKLDPGDDLNEWVISLDSGDEQPMEIKSPPKTVAETGPRPNQPEGSPGGLVPPKPRSATPVQKLTLVSGMVIDHGEDDEDDEDMTFITCDTCKKVFPTKQDLYRHEVVEHSAELPYKCTSCGRSFARKDRLSNHMRLHTGKSPHHCEFCGKTFTAASSLKEHLKIHSGTKPHRCPVCLKDFRQKCVLTRHMRNVHKSSISQVDNMDQPKDTAVTSPLKNNVAKVDLQQTGLVPALPTTTFTRLKEPNQKGIIRNQISLPISIKTSTPQPILPKPSVSLLTGLIVPNMQVAPGTSSPVVLVPITSSIASNLIAKPPEKPQTAKPQTKGTNCPLCGLVGMSDVTLRLHIKNNHPGYKIVSSHGFAHPQPGGLSIDSFRCVPCDVEFSSKDLLLEHCTLVHPSTPSGAPISVTPNSRTENVKQSSGMVYRCVWCRLDFQHKGALIEHCNSVHPSVGESYLPISVSHNVDRQQSSPSFDSMEQSNLSGSGSDLETSPQGMSLRTIPQTDALYVDGHKYRCALCAEGFESTQVLSEHMDQHMRSNPFFCNFCGQTFRNTSELEVHLEVHQLSEDPQYLSLAAASKEQEETDQTADLDETLTIDQVNTDDNGSGLYGCNFCFKAFSQVKTLVLHLRHHITDKPHICVLCGKAFSQSGYLKMHVRTHMGERPHVCSVCGRGFMHKAQLILHMAKHNGYGPYKCEHCDKTFSQKSTLKLHVLKHLPERPYSCSACGRGFTQAGNMRRHAMMVHRDLNLDQVRAVILPSLTTTKQPDADTSPASAYTLEAERPADTSTPDLDSNEGQDLGESPIDLSREVTAPETIVIDDPSDDLMVMGAYYSNQLNHSHDGPRDGTRPGKCDTENDVTVVEVTGPDLKDIRDVERECSMVDLTECYDCVEGLTDKAKLKNHLLENHKASLLL